MSVYKFLAWTSPGLQKILIDELAQYNIIAKPNPIYPSSAVFFNTTLENLHNILYKPTCITYLNLRINKPIQARNQKEFIKNMKTIQLHPYIPLNSLYNLRLSIRRCNINHSSSWHDTIINYIRNSNQNRKLIAERKQLLIGEQQQQQQQQQNEYISDLYSPKIPLQLNGYLYQNYFTLYIQLHMESLHKFGFKKYSGKATLSENIADALIQFCILNKGMTLWDPFCGSGTIILTLLAKYLNKNIRKGQFLPLYQLPIFNDFYQEQQIKELDFNIIANDIDQDQLKCFYKNLDDFFQLKRIIRQQSPQLKCKSYENLSIAQLDYKSMHKEFIKNKIEQNQLIIITNPPWGKTVNLDKFNKMIYFLENNCQQCYLIIADDQYQFFNKQKWILLAEPLVGGQWTKIIKFDKNNKNQKQIKELIQQDTNNNIINQTNINDIINKPLSYQRDIIEYQDKKIIQMNKEINSLSQKINNPEFIKHLKQITRKQAENHSIYLNKLHIGTKTKIRTIMLSRAQNLYKTKIRNYNLKILKLKEQIKNEQIELKKQEVKDKVILDKYQLTNDMTDKIQKVLDQKAKQKSIELLKQEKKRIRTIPKW